MSLINSSNELTRLRKRFEEQRDLLIFDAGKYIEAKDCADGWRKVNSFLLQANILKLYRVGNRHIVPRIKINIAKWENLIPMEDFGYKPELRMKRLMRNYLNEESLLACRMYMDRRNVGHHATHGISFGTGRKKTPPCMVGGTFHWATGRLLVDFYLRASEVTKTLGADLHFLDRVIKAAVPEWMSENLASVNIHMGMGFLLAQWFPLFDMICPGHPLNEEHRFHKMCLDSIRKARDIHGYHSKWRAERRIHSHYRKNIKKFRANREGRIIWGPSFFPCEAKYL